MKSLNFKKSNLQSQDLLSKAQMKKILGGHDGGTACPPGSCTWWELVSGGRLIPHEDGTCTARGGIQTGCACEGQTDSACEW